MSKQRWIFILGIWVAILPFLGFPRSWKNILFVITGLGLIYLSYLLRRERKGITPQTETMEEKPDTFTDNGHEILNKETEKQKNTETAKSEQGSAHGTTQEGSFNRENQQQ